MINHPSGFGAWQDLRAYLRSYNIISDDDETCRLIEEAYNHWPKQDGSKLYRVTLERLPQDATETVLRNVVAKTRGEALLLAQDLTLKATGVLRFAVKAEEETPLAPASHHAAVRDFEARITPHILRHWSRERIVRFAKHLLGDACQECEKPASHHAAQPPA